MFVHDFASDEEAYMNWYLLELELEGYIRDVEYQPKSFPICSPAKITHLVYGKRKGIFTKEVTLLQGSEYTADWAWIWTEKAKNIFFATHSYLNKKDYPFIANKSQIDPLIHFSVIDVKGNFDPNNNIRMFSMNQKIIYDKYGIYVQGIVPKPSVKIDDKVSPAKITVKPKSALFYSTFTPQRYLTTDVSNKPRKILYPVKTLKEFVDEQHNKLEALSGRLQEYNQTKIQARDN